MASKVDMSLDDIISKNKPNRGRRGRGRGRGGAGGGRGAGTGRGGRSRGRGMRTSRGRRSGPFRNSGIGSINGRWSHDMYYGGASAAAFSASPGPVKLNITNLEYGVSDSDIKELFSEFGNMRSASVHYDRTGRSLGSAHVVFERRPDALKAIRQYNGVHLDGRPMHIEIDGQSGGGSSFANGSSPVKRLQAGPRSVGGRGGARRGGRGGRGGGRGNFRAGSRGAGGRTGGRGRGRGGRGRGRGAKKVPTADELDAELDAYVMQASK